MNDNELHAGELERDPEKMVSPSPSIEEKAQTSSSVDNQQETQASARPKAVILDRVKFQPDAPSRRTVIIEDEQTGKMLRGVALSAGVLN